jgi:threonine-phosphate decarboxylase
MHNPFGIHGGNVLSAAREKGVAPDRVLDFSSNADSLCRDLTEKIVRSIDYPYHMYPDIGCPELTRALAADEQVEPDNILAGNGSSELIFLCFSALKPKRVRIVAPTFSEYVRACENLDIDHDLYLLEEENGFSLTESDMRAIAADPADMLVLCTPNNPTTAVYRDIAPLLQGAFRTVLVDNTYQEFLHGHPAHHDHGYARYRSQAAPDTAVISMQSFTKAFYCTGIRLGYLVAPIEIRNRLASHQPPWTVSRFAELAGLRFLDERERYRTQRKVIPGLREEFVKGLEKSGLFARIHRSEVNYLLCRLSVETDMERVQKGLLKAGILVRNCDSIPGMPRGHIRMQVRSREENERLLEGLEELR